MKLRDQVALVTGAGMGIGKVISSYLSGEGAKVAINDVDSDLAKSVSQELERSGREAIPVHADISKSRQVISMVDQVIQAFGKIDILVNNAGVTSPGLISIEELSEEEWDRVIDVNLKGTFLCSKAVIMPMKSRRYGRIINISSAAAKLGRTISNEKTKAHYCASKAGVISLTKSLARELASSGITVNAIAPGAIETEMTGAYDVEKACQEIPLKRFGKPEEVARAVLFLVSAESSYITGEILDINGGMIMD